MRGARRRLLAGGAAMLACPALVLHAQPRRDRNPFTLGVASGCPRPDGVVLWTRLALEPLAGGGMGDAAVPVQWELAADEGFRQVVASGSVRASADEAHSARVELSGLQPARDYWYRFTALGARSPAGRTRTAPAAGSNAPVRFAFASCQHYEQGWFTAYRDMATQQLDFVLHLGDYIYESSWGVRRVRRHETGIPTELHEFRDRYALYKGDAHLQAAHAAFPWVVTWDDHEVANDYTGDRSQRMQEPARFMKVRAAAYQAWYEHMPVPASMRPRNGMATIHASYRFGDQVDLLVLDGRQHRSPHVCLPGTSAQPLVDCAQRQDAARTFFGAAQEAWIDQQLQARPAKWTVLGQPTLLTPTNRGTRDAPAYWMDGWDGYPAARTRLLDALARHRPSNVVVASGDVHAFWAADVVREPGGPAVASEFVGGAITSEGPRAETVQRMLANNPHLRWGRADRRGYAVADIASERCRVEFRAVDDVADAASPVRPFQRFSVADGVAGVRVEGA
ncbi:alkaline phosphatase D family protein [Ramlibacter albus]|uniref:Alkaline phosphatase D family protein n=1 Tax=Ramlibacter albus TaxID=2079448 RepID=A0A923MFG3_9BURK|nr:alkaline phosphatase D family protein [Ramlibacter albus]MBC5768474.1 alkaline phosphatase D family protein [Ramlibacter albus]